MSIIGRLTSLPATFVSFLGFNFIYIKKNRKYHIITALKVSQIKINFLRLYPKKKSRISLKKMDTLKTTNSRRKIICI